MEVERAGHATRQWIQPNSAEPGKILYQHLIPAATRVRRSGPQIYTVCRECNQSLSLLLFGTTNMLGEQEVKDGVPARP